MAEEMLEIVDESGSPIELRPRSEIHRLGLLHREINVWLFTPQGAVILQKRGPHKDTFPNFYDASAGGHLDPGESWTTAALREVKEEIGIDVLVAELTFLYEQRSNNTDAKGAINNALRRHYGLCKSLSLAELTVEQHASSGFYEFQLDELKNAKQELKAMCCSQVLNPQLHIAIEQHLKSVKL
jgi:isopentenyl-diphosphate delta-isomerase